MPAAFISVSKAARCSGGMIGSSAPMQTSTLPLMLAASCGRAVARPEWKPTIAFTSAPLRPISSAVVPPKQ